MDENILILTGPADYQEYVAEVASRDADDLGLVLTHIALADEKTSGGRVEEQRDFGGVAFESFDEPVFIGSAIAQLAGHVDGVVVDRLDMWAERLLERFPDDRTELEAEVLSLVSVMKAQMAELVLVSGPTDRDGAVGDLVNQILEQIRPHCQRIVDRTGSEAVAVEGELPS